MILVVCSAPALMFMLVWLPQYLELARDIPRASVGQYLWLPPVLGDAGMVGFGLLASGPMAGSRRSASLGRLFVIAAALDASLVLVPWTPGPWAATLVVGLASAGAGGMYTLLTTDMVRRIDPARVGAASGLTASAQSLAYIILNPAVGAWVDRAHSFDVPLYVLGGLALPGALVWALWRIPYQPP
jgi:hypothetical protein